MIYEYALEPALLNNWKDFRYFTEKFGFSQGRLISRYPKRWKKMVYTSLSECKEIERKTIEERLRGLDDRMIRREHAWNPQDAWLTSAETEHDKRPFRAILAKSNPRGNDFVLVGDNVENDDPLFHVQQTLSTPRSAQKMATCIAPVLQWAKELLFIDPYFGPENKRYRATIRAFLNTALRGRAISCLTRVEIHTSDKTKAEANFFRDEARKQLPRLIPKGMKVRLFRWSERNAGEELHNRFILTDMGGVSFGTGLDEGKQGQTDQIWRLGEEEYHRLWCQYTSGSAFDLVDDIEIVGTSPLP